MSNTLDEILETLAAEAFIFGNFALGKGVSIPLPDNDNELPPVEKAHKAIQALITEARIDEMKRSLMFREDYWKSNAHRHFKYRIDRLTQLKENK